MRTEGIAIVILPADIKNNDSKMLLALSVSTLSHSAPLFFRGGMVLFIHFPVEKSFRCATLLKNFRMFLHSNT